MAFENVKHGKLPPKYNKRVPMLANFIEPRKLPQPHSNLWWGHRYQRAGISMSLNDQLGDCTIASKIHGVGLWSSDASTLVQLPDGAALKAYEAFGYVPGDPSTDNGAYMLDVAYYFRDTGIGGHKIDAFATVELGNLDMLRIAIDLGGWIDIGAALPKTCQDQPYVWSVVANTPDNEPGSWGGHDFILVGHNAQWFLGMTWNQLVWCTIPWIQKYVDEAYFYVSMDWISRGGQAPSGLDLNGLLEAQSQF